VLVIFESLRKLSPDIWKEGQGMGLVPSQWEMSMLPCVNNDRIIFSQLLVASLTSLAQLVT
jgi:hypothetical protein